MRHTWLGIWHRMLRRVGPLGLAAGIFTLGAVTLMAWAIELKTQRAALNQQLQAQATKATPPDLVMPASRVPVGQQIDEFVATFPPLSQNPADLGDVFQSAEHRQIQLFRGDYQFKNDANAALVVLTATFPLHAAYGPTKEFAADVLRALPHASMDELRMTRNAADVGELESSIRFSFVYRRPSYERH